MVLLHGNGALTPECSRNDFSDTPADGPRDAGSKNCADIFVDSAGAFNVKSFCCESCDTLGPFSPIKAINNPTKTNPDKMTKNPFKGSREFSPAGGSTSKSGV